MTTQPNRVETHLVVGAGGQTGRLLVEKLLARDHTVRAVGRHQIADLPSAVQFTSGDALDVGFLTSVARGTDVIHHVAGAPYHEWKVALPALMKSVLSACSRSGARLVYLDNLYSLGAPSAPMNESSPERPVDAKGELRWTVAEQVRVAEAQGDVRAAIARASDFYASGAPRTLADALVIAPLQARRRPSWPASPNQPHSLHYLPDIADALIILSEQSSALGHTWYFPADRPLTGREFSSLVGTALRSTADDVATLTRAKLTIASPFSRPARDLLGSLHQFDRPYEIDGASMRDVFGFTPTPHTKALASMFARK